MESDNCRQHNYFGSLWKWANFGGNIDGPIIKLLSFLFHKYLLYSWDMPIFLGAGRCHRWNRWASSNLLTKNILCLPQGPCLARFRIQNSLLARASGASPAAPEKPNIASGKMRFFARYSAVHWSREYMYVIFDYHRILCPILTLLGV